MKTLLIMRHAKSGWKKPGQSDFDRTLDERGLYDAPCMGQLLLRENLVPDLIISSAAQRARQTALLVAENCGYQKEIAFSQELYIASLDEYLQIIKENSYHEDRVLLVGHNPSVEYLLEKLTRKFETMPAAALAHVSVSVPGWKKLCFDTKAKLANLWRPNEL